MCYFWLFWILGTSCSRKKPKPLLSPLNLYKTTQDASHLDQWLPFSYSLCSFYLYFHLNLFSLICIRVFLFCYYLPKVIQGALVSSIAFYLCVNVLKISDCKLCILSLVFHQYLVPLYLGAVDAFPSSIHWLVFFQFRNSTLDYSLSISIIKQNLIIQWSVLPAHSQTWSISYLALDQATYSSLSQ